MNIVTSPYIIIRKAIQKPFNGDGVLHLIFKKMIMMKLGDSRTPYIVYIAFRNCLGLKLLYALTQWHHHNVHKKKILEAPMPRGIITSVSFRDSTPPCVRDKAVERLCAMHDI